MTMRELPILLQCLACVQAREYISHLEEGCSIKLRRERYIPPVRGLGIRLGDYDLCKP